MPSELAYLERVLTGTAIWVPQNPKQWQAFLSRADELYYGGAAGGGKTDLGLGLAMECHQRATFFRREFTDLSDVIVRGNEIAAPYHVQYNFQRRTWEFGERFVQLGAIDHEKQMSKYQGRPRDLYVWDEVTWFPREWVQFISGWRRSTDPNQRTRVLLLGNPPLTPEGNWIIEEFAPWLDNQHPYPAAPGELRWFAMIDKQSVEVGGPEPISYKGDTIQPISRTFIPAYLSDNPFYRDSDYETVLQNLPGILPDVLLKGLFGVTVEDDPWQVIPTAWVEAAQQRYINGQRPDVNLRAVGLDVSRGGQDDTVAAKLYHEWFELHAWPGREIPDGPAAADKALGVCLDDAAAPFFVDVIGWGASAYDDLKRRDGVTAHSINVANASTGTDKTGRFRFTNLRSEIYWRFREALDPSSEHAIALPPDRQVKVDLCAAKFKVIKSGIQVEPKEAIKARINRSPDKGDAILLAWHGATAPRGGISFS